MTEGPSENLFRPAKHPLDVKRRGGGSRELTVDVKERGLKK